MKQQRLSTAKDKHKFFKKSKKVESSQVAQMVKYLPAMQETWIWSLVWEDPLEKEMVTHSSILAWEIPRTEEPAGLQSMGLQKSDKTYQLNNNNNKNKGTAYLFMALELKSYVLAHSRCSIKKFFDRIIKCFIKTYCVQSRIRVGIRDTAWLKIWITKYLQ